MTAFGAANVDVSVNVDAGKQRRCRRDILVCEQRHRECCERGGACGPACESRGSQVDMGLDPAGGITYRAGEEVERIGRRRP